MNVYNLKHHFTVISMRALFVTWYNICTHVSFIDRQNVQYVRALEGVRYVKKKGQEFSILLFAGCILADSRVIDCQDIIPRLKSVTCGHVGKKTVVACRRVVLWNTVYPKKYAHGFCFAVLCCGYTLTDFPISIRLTSLALWQSNDCPSASKATLMNMDKYFMWIHYERLHNHNKAKHNKTVCIFLGIYCSVRMLRDYFRQLQWCHMDIMWPILLT